MPLSLSLSLYLYLSLSLSLSKVVEISQALGCPETLKLHYAAEDIAATCEGLGLSDGAGNHVIQVLQGLLSNLKTLNALESSAIASSLTAHTLRIESVGGPHTAAILDNALVLQLRFFALHFLLFVFSC